MVLMRCVSYSALSTLLRCCLRRHGGAERYRVCTYLSVQVYVQVTARRCRILCWVCGWNCRSCQGQLLFFYLELTLTTRKNKEEHKDLVPAASHSPSFSKFSFSSVFSCHKANMQITTPYIGTHTHALTAPLCPLTPLS